MGTDPNHAIKNITAKDVLVDDVITAVEGDKIREIESIMIKKGIGGVPVIREESSRTKVVGMLTQRDIVLAKASLSIGGMTVKELMSHNVVTVTEDAKLPDILKIMKINNIARIPVVDDKDSLVGMIVHKNILIRILEVLEKSSG
ncbi:MAG: CBS domain-containing protein [Candidatus Hodarchaeota archaeon]